MPFGTNVSYFAISSLISYYSFNLPIFACTASCFEFPKTFFYGLMTNTARSLVLQQKETISILSSDTQHHFDIEITDI